MKLTRLIMPLVALGLLVLAVSCKKEQEPKVKTTISLNKTTATVEVGKSVTLKVTLTPADASDKVAWVSSDTKIATVSDKGVVKGVKKGQATITAKLDNGNTAICKVTVKEKGETPAPGKTTISLDKQSASIAEGETVKLTATLNPESATDAITWESSDPATATVDNGSVKGVKAGKATISAKLENGNSATCEVTVTKKGDKPTPPPPAGNPIEVKQDPITFAMGDVLNLKEFVKFNPELGADEGVTLEEIQPADDPYYKLVLVLNQKNLTATANRTGECKLKITRSAYPDKAVTVTVVVKEKEFQLPEGAQILITGGDKVEGVKSVVFGPYGSYGMEKIKLTSKVVDKDGKEIPNVIVTRTFDDKKLQQDFTDETQFSACQDEDGEVSDFTTEIVYSVKGTKLTTKVTVECKTSMKGVEYKK